MLETGTAKTSLAESSCDTVSDSRRPPDKKPQEGLSEDPLTNPKEIWYTDGSNFVLDGKRRARCAVVSNFETIEAKSLPPVVKVPGHDSWIHYSQVKPWRKPEDTQYTVNKLQYAVPVQQGHKTIPNHGKYHLPLDGLHYKESEA